MRVPCPSESVPDYVIMDAPDSCPACKGKNWDFDNDIPMNEENEKYFPFCSEKCVSDYNAEEFIDNLSE